MSARCIGEPISWLRLERFHLGEMGASERAGIAEHLAGCPACAACLAHIQDDDARALPPLALSAPVRRRVFSLSPGRGAAVLGSLAAAAALVLSLRRGTPAKYIGLQATGESRVKGDAIAFALVRDDDERIPGAAGVYRDGDRFEALVTCPPGGDVAFDLVVYDAGGASFPLERPQELACGNGVRLPGAFRLTGGAEETVCLVWTDGEPLDRAELASRGRRDEHSLCKVLTAAPKPGPGQ